MDGLIQIARAEGVSGLYRGLVPTVVTNAPFSALYYMFYIQMQRLIQKVRVGWLAKGREGGGGGHMPKAREARWLLASAASKPDSCLLC